MEFSTNVNGISETRTHTETKNLQTSVFPFHFFLTFVIFQMIIGLRHTLKAFILLLPLPHHILGKITGIPYPLVSDQYLNLDIECMSSSSRKRCLPGAINISITPLYRTQCLAGNFMLRFDIVSYIREFIFRSEIQFSLLLLEKAYSIFAKSGGFHSQLVIDTY